jgi:hypothetical protein
VADHWREMLRLLTGQVNETRGVETRGVGSVSKRLLLKNPHFTDNRVLGVGRRVPTVIE